MTSNELYSSVPTWDNGTWTHTDFKERQDFVDFVLSLFKEPGKYEFDETVKEFSSQARKYNESHPNPELKYYCGYKEGSMDYRKYWDDQKEKCRKGVIFKANGKTWYLPREYYMWINFLPINDKLKKKFAFPEVWDTQYHMALYELLAELHYKHCAILKKRQIASSYYHCAKLINQLWFEETAIMKMGSSLKDKINEKGSWKFLDEYKSFLDSKTAWYRPMEPWKTLMWQQQIEEEINGRPILTGLKGTIQGLTLEKEPTAGVGGDCRIFFYEEAGIAPTMDQTKEYLMPAMQMGEIVTGVFIAAGSVGELDQCKPLQHMVMHPRVNDIYPVTTNLLDDKGTIGETGLFIPEQWSMPPFIDEFGNSKVEEALAYLNDKYEKAKKELEPETYQLRISQRPRNIAEAFAHRTVSVFPQHLVKAQKMRIEEKAYAYELLELSRDLDGKIVAKPSNKIPISEFPITKNVEDKSGCLIVWEKPDPNAEWGTYYASIDPVSEGKTRTSESLCSIYVYRNPVEVTKIDDEKVDSSVEGDRIVAAWCGRFDDLQKTHERLELIVEWYNAWTLVENNISLFIQYMIGRRKQKYLVPKNQILFLKDLGANSNVYSDYGWKNVGTLFKDHLISYLVQYLQEEIDVETKSDGEIVKRTYGIERIPDIMAMKEMESYQEGMNVDRLVSLAALIAFAKIQQSNRGYRKRVEYADKKHLQKSADLFKLTSTPFRHLGGSGSGAGKKPPRNPFKNLR